MAAHFSLLSDAYIFLFKRHLFVYLITYMLLIVSQFFKHCNHYTWYPKERAKNCWKLGNKMYGDKNFEAQKKENSSRQTKESEEKENKKVFKRSY